MPNFPFPFFLNWNKTQQVLVKGKLQTWVSFCCSCYFRIQDNEHTLHMYCNLTEHHA